MSKEEPPEVIKEFAPILHFHPDEGSYCCYPTDAEETYRKYGKDWTEFEKMLGPTELGPTALCYYEMWKDKQMTQLRYWFWYNYNRFPRAPLGLGEHLGDWEHIEVRIFSESEIIWLLSNHLTARVVGIPEGLYLEGFEYAPPILERKQIHSWVALGSHSHYPSPDSDPYCVAGILCDKIKDDGIQWDTVDALRDLRKTNFYKFQGRWGDSGAPRSPSNEYNNRWRNAADQKPQFRDVSTG